MDRDRLADYLEQYKARFTSYGWKENKYKWQAVKTFQDNWDGRAFDWCGMLKNSLEGAGRIVGINEEDETTLLQDIVKMVTDDARVMFDNLYDENRDVYRRIKDFLNYEDVVFNRNGIRKKVRYQSPYAVSVLLWLKFPDKYYQYSFGAIKWAAIHLNANGSGTEAAQFDIDSDFRSNFMAASAIYDEIRDALRKDTAFLEVFRGKIDASCWPDEELITLTCDVVDFIAKNYSTQDAPDDIRWSPAGYDPEITVEEWTELLSDPDIFDDEALATVARLKDYGGAASCDDLAKNYGKTKHYYNTTSTNAAKKVIEASGCAVSEDEDRFARLLSVIYEWRYLREFDEVNMIWKLRSELSDALDKIDLKDIELYSDVVPRSRIKNFWWLNTNPKVWGFSHSAVGDIKAFSLYNDNGYKRRIFDNFLNARVGDIVIGYESHPSNQIVGLGRVSTAQDGKYIYFEKTEGLSLPIDYAVVRNNPELGKMEFFKNMQGSLFKVNQGEYDRIMDIIREENPLRDNTAIPKYTREDFLNEVYMTGESYDELVTVLKNKKNIILQGAPGVGKTFTANRLAYSMMGEKDSSRIEFAQFHQNYSYEDFMLGYRPTDNGFELKYGIFYRFCLLAGNQPDKDFFFIIDEINRGNMSRIFGELLMMIEADYRGTKTTLSYNGLSFMVPKNLYIIGMMNTADRSLALIDYALRRRFGFFGIEPRFDSEGFTRYQRSLNDPNLDKLVLKVKELNREIEADPSLGKGFCIGHSYFCGRTECSRAWLRSIVDFDIVPTLREYWFDEPSKVAKWEKELLEAVD